MPIGLLVGGGVSLLGNIFGGIKGSNSAAQAGQIAEQGAQQVATLEQNTASKAGAELAPLIAQGQGQIAAGIGNLAPYQAAGKQGITSLASALAPGGAISKSLSTPFSFDPNSFTNTPGYQFQLKQGLDAVQSSAAARGVLGSGGTLKGINNYAQGVAGTYENQYFNQALEGYNTNRQNALYSLAALGNLAGYGQSANAQALQGYEGMANLGAMGGTQIGNWMMGGAQGAGQALMQGYGAAANAALGQGAAWQGAMGNISNTIGNLGGMYSYNNNWGQGGQTESPDWSSFVGP